MATTSSDWDASAAGAAPPKSVHPLLPHGGSLPLVDWQRRHRMIVALLWCSILSVAVYAVASHDWEPALDLPVLAVLLLCGALAERSAGSRKWRSIASSLGLLICAAALVDVSGGLIEMHFAFFVVVVVLTLYEDWIPFLLAVNFVLLHHGIIGTIDPQAVFNRPQEWSDPWAWAAFHAVFIALAGAAGVTAWRLNEQVRDRMRAAQEELASILDFAGDAVFGLDRKGRITFANPEALRITGHAADELIGREFCDAVPYTRPDGSPCPVSDSPVTQALEHGTVHDRGGELYLQTDETSVPIEISCTPIIDAGRVTGAVVVTRDVSGRREAERAREELTSTLARQQAQLNEAQSVAQCGSWEWDVAADSIDWSDELCRIFGLRPGEHPRSFDAYLDLMHQDDRPRVRATIEAAYTSGEPFSFKCRVVRPDASERLIFGAGEVRGAADGAPPRMLGTVQDITERELIDAELRRSSRYFALSRDLVCAVDLDGRFAQVNSAWTRTLGWTEDELLGHLVLEFLHPDDRRAARADGDAGWFGSQPVNRYRTTDGGWRWLEWSSLSEPQERMIYASARDVTDRRTTELELAEAHDHALEASRLKSEFLANMSHEIRTPLNGVIGIGGLLLTTNLDREQREYVEAVGASGEALMSVVNDILDFSKIEAGKLELDRHAFDVREVVDDVWSMLATTAHDKNLELIAWVDEQLPDAVYGDSVRVRQVLTNFATNAIKFTATGEVVVRVNVQSPGDGAAGAIRFAVTDTGIGVGRDSLESIFDAFSQADSSTTRRYGGTGLGLAISRQLVDLMGGRIGVESDLGAGSTFWFTIPLTPVGADPGGRRGPDFEAARILVVDAHLTSRTILEEQLNSWNIVCHTAADPDGAIRLLGAAASAGLPYALAVIDVRNTVDHGIALATRIKATPALNATRLLMLSSSASTRPAASDAGIEAFLTKPVRRSRLADEIGRLLGDRELARRPLADPGDAALPVAEDVRRSVLLAEDNQINQLVAVRMLEHRGFRVDVAVNGREAVRMHQSGAYELIFMDCQMPDLDGYAATGEIRRAESRGRRTPIIAMTANTLKGDREKCLAAGMDDYLGKPLRSTELETVIARALATSEPTHPAGGVPTVGLRNGAPEPPPLLVDSAILTEVFAGDTAARAAVVAEFCSDSRAAIDELAIVLASGGAEAAERLAHTLKGSAAAVGATRLSRAAADLGHSLGTGDLDEARAAAVELEQTLELTHDALRVRFA
jgi:hypothetical protein